MKVFARAAVGINILRARNFWRRNVGLPNLQDLGSGRGYAHHIGCNRRDLALIHGVIHGRSGEAAWRPCVTRRGRLFHRKMTAEIRKRDDAPTRVID